MNKQFIKGIYADGYSKITPKQKRKLLKWWKELADYMDKLKFTLKNIKEE